MERCKILVTGGAGYIGSVLVPELLTLGHDVRVMDSFMYGQSSLSECCWYDRFDVIRQDVRDRAALRDAVKGRDYIIPLAALVGAPLCKADEIGAITVNRDSIQTLTELLSREQRVVMPVTNSGYGIGQQGVYCTEETPLNPVSLYGRTKVEAEKLVLSRENSISLRLATVFGMSSRMRLDLLVNDFAYRAVKDRFIVVFEGHYKRNYLHIRDVVRAFVHVIENFDTMKSEVYNVGLSDANISKLELCETIRAQVPDFVYFEASVGQDPDKRDYVVSNQKIERTGYAPKFPLKHGIRELIKGYKIINNSRYTNV